MKHWVVVALGLVVMGCNYDRPGMLMPDDAASDAAIDASVDDGMDAPFDALPPCATCQLLAVHPEVARSGDTITLEGTFVAPTMVTFPGGEAVVATLLGANRATVVVPASATSGDLVATSGSTQLASQEFRRATFQLGLRSFAPYELDQRPNPQLGSDRFLPAVTRVGNYVYAFGGLSTAPLATIERAPINADGSLGGFENAGSMFTPRAGASAHVIGNHVYVVGGFTTGTVFVSSVERAVINADDTLGPFATVSSTLSRVTGQHGSAIIGKYVYTFGGNELSSNHAFETIQRAEIMADGSLADFANVGSLTSQRIESAVAVSSDHVYVIGGFDDDSSVTTLVEAAPINADGTLGSFVPVSTMINGRHGAGALVVNDKLYVAGGLSTTTEVATIGSGGTLSSWTVVPNAALTPSRYGGGHVLVGGFFYNVGGSGSFKALVERASLDASAELGSFSTSNTLVVSRNRATMVVVGSWLYVIGGYDNAGANLRSIERAPIAPDGTIGAFATISSQLVSPRAFHQSLVIGSRVFVIGGHSTGSAVATIESAPIMADGSLGAFTTHASTLAVATLAGSMVATRTNVYVISGTSGTHVQRAAITGGDLGSFSTIANLPGRRDAPVAIVAHDKLHIIGGNGNGTQQSIDTATINADGSLSAFTTTSTALTTPRYNAVGAVVGSNLYVIGGNMPASVATIERATINSDGTLGPFSTYSKSLLATRASATAALVGNHLHVIGGTSGTVGGAVNMNRTDNEVSILE